MQTTLILKERTYAEAEQAFEQHVRFKLHEFLQNDCILTPEGIERVMQILREIYTQDTHSMMVQFELKIETDSAYSPYRGVISQYCQESSAGIMNTVNNAAALAGFHILRSTAKHLAKLDDKAHKRLPN
jgi:hypothetical protein